MIAKGQPTRVLRERIRVLHVLPWLLYGGVERRRLLLAEGLPSDRFDQTIACFRALPELRRDFESAGTTVIELGPSGGLARSIWTGVSLSRMVRQWKPHIVHGAVFEGCVMATVARMLARSSVLLIEETSVADNRSPRGHWLFRLMSGRADSCVAVSQAVAKKLVDATRVDRQKIRVVMNAVQEPRPVREEEVSSLREKLGLRSGIPVVGCVARMYDESSKRILDLLRAVEVLRKEGRRLACLMVGDGPQVERYREFCRQRGLEEDVVFAGAQLDVPLYLGAMDVFALSSEREAFGLVLVEAMLCGLPVVATNVGGVPEIVDHGKTGVLVPARDVHALAAGIGGLLDDPASRQEMGQSGRQRALDFFMAERYVRDVARLYLETLGAM